MSNAVKKEDYTRSGHHMYKKGSEKVVIGNQTLYIHEPSFHLIVYTGERHLWINNIYETQVQFQNEVDKLITKLKEDSVPKVEHSLTKGVILVSNTLINNTALNMVEFYEVTEVVDDYHVRICLIDQQVMQYGNYKAAIPRAGIFVGEPIERRVIADTVKITGMRIASLANFQSYDLAGLQYKVYEAYPFGLTI